MNGQNPHCTRVSEASGTRKRTPQCGMIRATTQRALTLRNWRSAAEGSHRHNLDERP